MCYSSRVHIVLTFVYTCGDTSVYIVQEAGSWDNLTSANDSTRDFEQNGFNTFKSFIVWHFNFFDRYLSATPLTTKLLNAFAIRILDTHTFCMYM